MTSQASIAPVISERSTSDADRHADEARKRAEYRASLYTVSRFERYGSSFISNANVFFFSPNSTVPPRSQPPDPAFDPTSLRELQLPVWYKRPEVAWKSAVLINMPFSGLFSCLRDRYCRSIEFDSVRDVWHLNSDVAQSWITLLDNIHTCLSCVRTGSFGFPMLMETPPRPDFALRKGYKRLNDANIGVVEARNQIIVHVSAFFWFVRSLDSILPSTINNPASESSTRANTPEWLPLWFTVVVRDYPQLQGWLSAVRSYWIGARNTRISGMFFDWKHISTSMPTLNWLYEHNVPVWYPWGDEEQALADKNVRVAQFQPPQSCFVDALQERDRAQPGSLSVIEHDSHDPFLPVVTLRGPSAPLDDTALDLNVSDMTTSKPHEAPYSILSSGVARLQAPDVEISSQPSAMTFFHPRRRLAARPYGQDMVHFFHQRTIQNEYLARLETEQQKMRRQSLQKVNPDVHVFEWAEYLVPEGNFLVLAKFERIYRDELSRMNGVQNLIYDEELMHTFDSIHNELHFVCADDTFTPPTIIKYKQHHPEFADEEDETIHDDWSGLSSGMRDVVNNEGALHIAYYRLAFHGRPADTGNDVTHNMWTVVLDKLQCNSPSLSEISPDMARGLWQYLSKFDNTLPEVGHAASVSTVRRPHTDVNTSSFSSFDVDPTGVVHSLVYFFGVDEIDDIRQAGLRHHSASGEEYNVEAKSARSYMWRGTHSNLVIIGSSKSQSDNSSGSSLPGQTRYSNDGWKLVVTAGIDAIHACRLISEGEDIISVALELCNRGIPFRTMVWAGWNSSDYRAKAKPIRLDGHQWTSWDYHEYLRERAELLRIPWIRRSCYMAGGILWRIAVDVAGPPSRSVFEAGPSEAARRGQHACNIRGWVDDDLPEDVVALLVGLYLCPQMPNQSIDEYVDLSAEPTHGAASLKRPSWWPMPSSFWQQSVGSLGHWSVRAESWYVKRREALNTSYPKDGIETGSERPKLSSHWRNSMRFGKYSKRMLDHVEGSTINMIQREGKHISLSGLPYLE